MVWCDFLSAASAFIVLLVLIYGSWHALFFATLVSAILSQFSQPSVMKLFKQHLPAEQLQGIMAMFQSLMAVFLVVGPIIGTFVYQQYGINISISIMGIMSIASALVLYSLPRAPAKTVEAAEDQHFIEELKDGLRYVWTSRVLRTLGGNFAIAGLVVGLMQPLMIYLSIENLGQDKSFLQWLLTANGAAMLVGGGAVMAISRKVSPQLLLAFGLLISAVSTIALGWSTSVAITLTLEFVTGLCFPCIHISINTLILKNTEVSFVGRVGGVLTLCLWG